MKVAGDGRSSSQRFKRAVLVVVTVGSAAVPAVRAGSGFAAAIERASAPVVKLYGLSAGIQEGYGTGIIVSPEGHVLTVLSILLDARTVRAVDSRGVRFVADVLVRDRQRQLALLRLRPADAARDVAPPEPVSADEPSAPVYPFFDLSQPGALLPGDWIIAAGNAFKVADGAEPVSISHGVFSVRTRLDARRRVRDFVYTGDVLVIDAITSNPGAPGSAVVNLDGAFVGMIGRDVESHLTHTHLNYALPADVLRTFYQEALAVLEGDDPLVDDLSSARAHPIRSDTGIRMARAGYRRVLPFVERVVPGSPAAAAGLRKDDLIVTINGRDVPDVEAFDRRLEALAADAPIELVVLREKKYVTLTLVPSPLPESEP